MSKVIDFAEAQRKAFIRREMAKHPKPKREPKSAWDRIKDRMPWKPGGDAA